MIPTLTKATAVDNEEKLKDLIIGESKLEDQVLLCKCPLTFAKLMNDISSVRYKMECLKVRCKGYKERPENFICRNDLREY
jgi:hypothetical protein